MIEVTELTNAELSKLKSACWAEQQRREAELWVEQWTPVVGRWYKLETAYGSNRQMWVRYFLAKRLEPETKNVLGFEFYTDEFGAISIRPDAKVGEVHAWKGITRKEFEEAWTDLIESISTIRETVTA